MTAASNLARERQTRSRSLRSSIAWIFGVTEQTRLPGPVIVNLAADLGALETTTRTTIARMQRDGSLRGTRIGRVTEYELAGISAAAFERAERGADGAQSEWDGTFHGVMFRVPERMHEHRDRIRSAATLGGYALMRPGMMIGLHDRWADIEARIGALPKAITLHPFELRMPLDAARETAADAWHLDAVAKDIRATTRRLRRESERSTTPTGARALRTLHDATVEVYHPLFELPALPPELLPEKWPLPEMLDALRAVNAKYATEVGAHVANRLAS